MGFRSTAKMRLSLAATAIWLTLCQEARVAADPKPVVSAVRGVEVVVGDLERSRAFFELLGFSALDERELAGDAEADRTGIPNARVRSLPLVLGTERVTLRKFTTPKSGRSIPLDSRGNDLWFQHVAIVVRDLDRAYGWLRAHHVAHVSSGPQTLPRWNKNAAGIRAFYFADPDGHTLELIQFPRGKGAPRWQTPTRCTRSPAELCEFLGIDHTAITVADTDRSLALYRDGLGFKVAGTSENYGPEQEHLNGVFGARLRITALRAASGPGIELLEYLSPRGGRPAPSDARADDLSHWQIDVEAPDPEAVGSAVEAGGGRAVSRVRSRRELLVRDRDGHALFVGVGTTT